MTGMRCLFLQRPENPGPEKWTAGNIFPEKEEFERKIAESGLIEYACYCDNYYGTPREYVEKQLADGRDVILEIEIQGAYKVKEQYPDALTLFVMTPGAEELRYRLESRGTESAEVIEKRMQRAAQEALGIEKYEYIVVNDNLEKCVDEVHRIIIAAHNAPHRNREFIDNIRRELEGEK